MTHRMTGGCEGNGYPTSWAVDLTFDPEPDRAKPEGTALSQRGTRVPRPPGGGADEGERARNEGT